MRNNVEADYEKQRGGRHPINILTLSISTVFRPPSPEILHDIQSDHRESFAQTEAPAQ